MWNFLCGVRVFTFVDDSIYGTVQYSTVQYSTVRYGTVLYSTTHLESIVLFCLLPYI